MIVINGLIRHQSYSFFFKNISLTCFLTDLSLLPLDRGTTPGRPCWVRVCGCSRCPSRACQSWSEPGYRKSPCTTWKSETWSSRSASREVRKGLYGCLVIRIVFSSSFSSSFLLISYVSQIWMHPCAAFLKE